MISSRVTPTRRAALAIGFALMASAVSDCSRRDMTAAPRCAFCGMRVAAGSHWAAGAVADSGTALAFDTPACLFRYRQAHGAASMRGEWVTEYYSQAGTHADARTLRYVVGSDLVGPMGPDVIPIEPVRVDAFKRDHHGRADLPFGEVTPTVIHGL